MGTAVDLRNSQGPGWGELPEGQGVTLGENKTQRERLNRSQQERTMAKFPLQQEHGDTETSGDPGRKEGQMRIRVFARLDAGTAAETDTVEGPPSLQLPTGDLRLLREGHGSFQREAQLPVSVSH